MQKLIIREILNTVVANIENTVDVGLVKGRTVVAIFLYECAKLFSCNDCRTIADGLIKSIYKDIRPNMQINVYNGIGGIGIGMAYLMAERFFEGNVDAILSDVDEKVFKDEELSVLSDTMYGGRLFTAGLYYYARFVTGGSEDNNAYINNLLIMTDFFIKQAKKGDTNIVEFSFVNSMLEVLIQLYLKVECSEIKRRIADLLFTTKNFHNKFRRTPLDLYVFENIVSQLSFDKWQHCLPNKDDITKGNRFEKTEKDEICYLWMSFILRKKYTDADICWAKEFVKKTLYNYVYDINSVNSRLSIVGLCTMKSLLQNK